MNITQRKPIEFPYTKPVAISLMLLMVVTRFDHVGSPFTLPDASLAVFFLAGLWLGSARFFAVLLVEAALIDFVAIQFFGVSGFCVSPAYVFLIPAYAALWFGGKWCAQFNDVSWISLMKQFVTLLVATTLAFLISELSFYLLSDRYDTLDWLRITSDMANFYPDYVKATVIYSTVIFTVVSLLKSVPSFSAKSKSA